ncbi:glycoside hydrolase family 3 N-terminal domain-containing protein [Catellatospora sp. NPDC049609]|uniref:glycoside hydrolase family 3 protein n=1 Tax=Catellatospora sp. NPDC049609 TaxID=3155505 RepID=UPI003442E1CB
MTTTLSAPPIAPPPPPRRPTRWLIAAGLALVLLAAGGVYFFLRDDDSGGFDPDAPYLDASRPVAERVDDLLGRMTLDEKLGQMTQAERKEVGAGEVTSYALGSLLSGGGSVPADNTPQGWADMYDAFQTEALATRLRIPMIYGVDAVHGHNNVKGATIFPHNIGLGATRDPGLVRRIGETVAIEVTATGLDWDFAPCLCVARDIRWGRTYESFGEDPEIASSMTTIVTGLQGERLGGPNSVLATAKHYVGDGATKGGKDQGDAQIAEEELRKIHLPPFQAAVKAGVGSVMISFSSFNGVKLHGHRYLITDVLKGELGFTGFVVSDWNAIDQIDGVRDQFTPAEVSTAINAGIDMVMVPERWREFIAVLRDEVNAGTVPVSRIDDANRRILTKKFELGMFEHPMADRTQFDKVGAQAHRDLARQAVRQSQVLLKNDGILPLSPKTPKVFVAGRHADDIGRQSGGWTLTWQGEPGAITDGTTILQGIKDTVDPATTVTYSADGTGLDRGYGVAIAVVGEAPYAEYEGDRPDGVTLDQSDLETLDRLRASGVPVVVVLVSGRPMDVTARLPRWKALLAAWLPGTEGAGVADVLFGAHPPTGKLPMSWPTTPDQEPVNKGDEKTPLFPYGFGLTY